MLCSENLRVPGRPGGRYSPILQSPLLWRWGLPLPRELPIGRRLSGVRVYTVVSSPPVFSFRNGLCLRYPPWTALTPYSGVLQSSRWLSIHKLPGRPHLLPRGPIGVTKWRTIGSQCVRWMVCLPVTLTGLSVGLTPVVGWVLCGSSVGWPMWWYALPLSMFMGRAESEGCLRPPFPRPSIKSVGRGWCF
jgi:hypothetical protein